MTRVVRKEEAPFPVPPVLSWTGKSLASSRPDMDANAQLLLELTPPSHGHDLEVQPCSHRSIGEGHVAFRGAGQRDGGAAGVSHALEMSDGCHKYK